MLYAIPVRKKMLPGILQNKHMTMLLIKWYMCFSQYNYNVYTCMLYNPVLCVYLNYFI